MPEERQSINWLLSLIDKVSVIFGYISGGFVFLMMVIIGYDVVMRHIFNDPTIWADEVSCYLLVGVTFLGAAYTLTMGGHIHVETLVVRLKPKFRQRLELIADVLTLAFLVVLTRQGYWLVKDSYVSTKISATLLRTPLYIPQILLAVGLMWLCLQLLVHILRHNISQNVHSGVRRRANKDAKQEKGSS